MLLRIRAFGALAVLLSSGTCAGGESDSSALTADSVIAAFLENLPIDSTIPGMSPEERSDELFGALGDEDDFERAQAAARMEDRRKARRVPAAAVPEPFVGKFMANALRAPDSVAIREVRSYRRDLKSRLARAVCHNGRPQIEYYHDIPAQYSPYIFAFIRAHEFGHIRLGHLNCSGANPRIDVSTREYHADCEAERVIVETVPNGVLVVSYAAHRMSRAGVRKKDGYPSSDERAQNLYNCP